MQNNEIDLFVNLIQYSVQPFPTETEPAASTALLAAKAQDKAARWEVLALTMAAALVLTLSIAAHQANEAARWRYEAQGMGQTEIVTPQNQNTAVQP